MAIKEINKLIHKELIKRFSFYTPYYFTISDGISNKILCDSREILCRELQPFYTFSADALQDAISYINFYNRDFFRLPIIYCRLIIRVYKTDSNSVRAVARRPSIFIDLKSLDYIFRS